MKGGLHLRNPCCRDPSPSCLYGEGASLSESLLTAPFPSCLLLQDLPRRARPAVVLGLSVVWIQ